MQPGRDLALVTGASSGIGAEFARQLAARSIDLVITARRKDRLERLAAEVTAVHKIKVTVIDIDLERPDGVERLLGELAARQLSPTILINNAGFGSYGDFNEQPLNEIEGMLAVNIRAATLLCRRLCEEMVKRKHGYILNVASASAFLPIPYYAVYSATKAYLVTLTQAVRHELEGTGVKLSVVCPGFTKTEFFDVAHGAKTSSIQRMEMSPESVCRAALRGLLANQLVVVPGARFKLYTMLSRIAPRFLVSALTANAVKMGQASSN
jgi:short-subunit dehydrogenase